MPRRARGAKAKAGARRPAAPRARASAGARVRDLEARLTQAQGREGEAAAQQAATADILAIISRSPGDAQPVFDAIAAHALELCGARGAVVVRYDGTLMHLAAHRNVNPEAVAILRGQYPRAPERTLPIGRAVLDAAVVHVPDLQAATEFSGVVAARFGARSHVVIPLLHHGRAIGAIAISRPEVGPFSDRQLALLQIFAAQAVIAIENARRLAETTEALGQQTATAEILGVISRSPGDAQPVFDAIVANAARLCAAHDAQVLRVEGDVLRLVAAFGTSSMPPVRPLTRGHLVGRAVLERRTIHVRDQAQALAEYPETSAPRYGVESALAVPLLRDGDALGVIRVSRTHVEPFTDKQIALLKTFADQAVIAVDNARLFTELETRNRALTEALDQQTATSDILRVISGAQQDAQPVFDTIVRSAVRLCRAGTAAVFLTDGRTISHPSNYGSAPEALAAMRARYPRPLDMETAGGIAILTRAVVHVPDSEEAGVLEMVRDAGRVIGFRSMLVVPMLRDGEPVGALAVTRPAPGRFSDADVDLLKTFADQAVIAIQNVRLFMELQARTAELARSVEQLTALGEVGRAVSSTLDLETVLTTIVSRAVQLSGLDGGVVFEYDDATEELVHRAQAGTGGARAAARVATRHRKGEGAIGRTAITLEPVEMPDITVAGAYVGPNRDNLIASGIRALLAVPMVREGRLVGCLGVSRNRPGDFPAETIELLRTFATQSALAIQNARLFRELADKSRQLEIASQHKSEFLASMSHELRTPLNAIIGFSDVLLQGMFGETNDKQTEYLRDILASGQHLLSLINDILDLSKVEAGRMELDLSAFDLPVAIDDALTLMRERATRRAITLERQFGPGVGEIRADQRKVKQVLLNLLSNAVKFTPEGGRVDVRAGLVDGGVEIAVADTGVGIAPEDQAAVFEEFRQVGGADRKAEGTGLGLALCRRFVELHGGRIRVESRVGAGSTFAFTLPLAHGA